MQYCTAPRHAEPRRPRMLPCYTASMLPDPTGAAHAPGPPWTQGRTSPKLPLFERYPLYPEDVYGVDADFYGVDNSDDDSLPDPAPVPAVANVSWDDLTVRVFRQCVSVRDAMEMARQLALAAVEWDVPTACWIPTAVALAAAADILGQDFPLLPLPADGCSLPASAAPPRPGPWLLPCATTSWQPAQPSSARTIAGG